MKSIITIMMSHIEHMAQHLVAKKTGYSFEGLSEDMPQLRDLFHKIPNGFEWIDKPAEVRGEDFMYTAQVLCSFPKSSGKVRYIVEDHGRIFVQRRDQITFLDRSYDCQTKEKKKT